MARRKRRTTKGGRRGELKNNLEVSVDKILRDIFEDVKYETETLPYVIEGNYRPDFICTDEKGEKLYVEAKGYFDPEARRKMKAVRKAHPDKKFLLVCQRDSTLRKGGKMRYSDWARRYGFHFTTVNKLHKWLNRFNKGDFDE